jgi:hypothetical protein
MSLEGGSRNMIVKTIFLAFFFLILTGSENARAESCFTPNASVSLGYPSVIEANAGFTAGSAHVNPQSSCAGAMFDLGVSAGGARAAVGYRGFQRYDWPSAEQYNAFIYKAYPGSDYFYGGTCAGVEAGRGGLLMMIRVGLAMCTHRRLPILSANFGLFY